MHIDISELHRRTPITDGHSDSLMWNRDLNRLSEKGQVDFPRLRQAGVKIQCFTIVTRGFPVIDGFQTFATLCRWPKAFRKGEWARTLFQLQQMEQFCAQSRNTASIVHSKADLDRNLENNVLSVILGVEGAHALEGQVERVSTLFSRGVRFMSLTHLSNNELGGSSSPLMGNRALSPLGRNVLEEMVKQGMAVDLAHASPRTLQEILEHPTARIFCSHGGVQGAKRLWRNLSDDVLRKIAERRGVMGVIFATIFLGGKEVDDVVRHIEYAIEMMGDEHVGLGSDFDGMVALPRGMKDVRDLHVLTQALVQRGHGEERIERVLGRNYRRFWGEVLPG